MMKEFKLNKKGKDALLKDAQKLAKKDLEKNPNKLIKIFIQQNPSIRCDNCDGQLFHIESKLKCRNCDKEFLLKLKK